MTKPKTLEQLRAEKERAETQLAQEQLQDIECTIPQLTTPLDCQKADRQDHLYRPCPFQRDRQGDDGGQNQASAP